MLAKRIVEVPLPEGVDPDPADLELLRATFQALATLRCEKGERWERLVRHLRDDGWTVRWGLTWRAEAKRGEDYEQATGATLDEALEGVAQLVLLDTVGRMP